MQVKCVVSVKSTCEEHVLGAVLGLAIRVIAIDAFKHQIYT